MHDLTNRKSQQNLNRWLAEVLIREGNSSRARTPLVEDFDAEQFGGFSQVYSGKKVGQFISFLYLISCGSFWDQLYLYG